MELGPPSIVTTPPLLPKDLKLNSDEERTASSRSPLTTPTGYSVTTQNDAGGLGLQASHSGVSLICQCEKKVLLLGNAKNALAACENTIPGYDVTHVISLASTKNSNVLQAAASGQMIRQPQILEMLTSHDGGTRSGF